MNTDSNQAAMSEAVSTLESIEGVERSVLKLAQPPLWLNLVISSLLGIATFLTASRGLSGQDDISDLFELAFMFLVLGFCAYSFYKLRKQGIAPKRVPPSPLGKTLLVGYSVFFAAVLFGSWWLSERGYSWVLYIAVLANFSATFFCLQKFPNGEWIPGESGE